MVEIDRLNVGVVLSRYNRGSEIRYTLCFGDGTGCVIWHRFPVCVKTELQARVEAQKLFAKWQKQFKKLEVKAQTANR